MSLQLRGALHRASPAPFHLRFALELPANQLTAICGPSGSGKTTLLRCIAGLEPRFQGTVRIGPRVWQDTDTRLPVHRRAIGYVAQGGELFPHLTVDRNLRFAWDRTPGDRRRIALDEVISLLDLVPLLSRATTELSGGEHQRVALGRALLKSPDLMLLDEPLAALDPPTRRTIFPVLEDIVHRFSVPMLYVTHAVDEAARLADHLVLMSGGEVAHQGPLAELLTSPAPGLAHGRDAGAVVCTTVTDLDRNYHLARLAFDGGELQVSDRDLPLGFAVRLRVHARDVSLALAPPHDTSILNVLPATVVDLLPDGPARVMVRLRVGTTLLLAAITTRSADTLRLTPGLAVWAQIKSVALL